ncbi:uncharacterized protein LOC127087601 isoform X2 [Lathyrus oleraceus]|uniref:uncharacterized protein LOC127087601 isoform X1 n=1 Tax=Pisum sativum TaxID=3888 RepID=UPI0021D06570|nr:uncharacterized protein LOC127087601 isoform X1 [Pisum sativum]XP_050884476.1 uncharacterized protein LOC127087601 isoform X2 [Pisum sativum]
MVILRRQGLQSSWSSFKSREGCFNEERALNPPRFARVSEKKKKKRMEKESERRANRVQSNLQRLKGTHQQRTNSLSYKPSDCSANLTGATQFQSILPNQVTSSELSRS